MTDYDSVNEETSAEDEEARLKAMVTRASETVKVAQWFAEFAEQLAGKCGYGHEVVRDAAFHWLADTAESREDFLDDAEAAADGIEDEDEEEEDDEDEDDD
jgi:hypothetical protein